MVQRKPVKDLDYQTVSSGFTGAEEKGYWIGGFVEIGNVRNAYLTEKQAQRAEEAINKTIMEQVNLIFRENAKKSSLEKV